MNIVFQIVIRKQIRVINSVGPRLSTQRWHGYCPAYVVVPTIRRGRRFVTYSTTVFVCIPRLLAVVVSLKICRPSFTVYE